MKAWHVQDTQCEHQEIIFAEKRSKAMSQSEAYSLEGEWTNVRARRAEYADGLENNPDEVIKASIQNGWWYECFGCSNLVTEEKKYLIRAGRVYCENCQEGATNGSS
ncbi:hypothetical protein [Oceanobacillus sp. FSL W7-1281]|uniref:hypothetical protein n=1 Tax=Oceanobacillus sp. FSL W7-1281 TaxID=2921698 RepID=UPI0030D73755